MKTAFLSFSITDSTLTDYFFEVAAQLSKTHQVIIFTDKNQKHPFQVPPSAKIYKWPSPRPGKIKDFVFLISKIIKHRPDVMVSMFGSVNIFLIVGFMFMIKRRIAWSRTVSTAFNDNKGLMFRKRLIFKLATELIANSEATKHDLVENFRVPPAKVRIFPNAVRKQPRNPERNPNKIMYVGRLHAAKGVDTLLAAMPIVVQEFPDVELVLIGGHLGFNTIKRYSEMAESLGVGKNVTFLGTKSRPEVLNELSDAAFTVFPSFAEGFGWVIIESFSVGTPVIGTNSTSIKEIIRDGVDGFLFEPGNSPELSAKMITMLASPSMQQEFSKNCLGRFQDEYDVEKIAVDVANYLTE